MKLAVHYQNAMAGSCSWADYPRMPSSSYFLNPIKHHNISPITLSSKTSQIHNISRLHHHITITPPIPEEEESQEEEEEDINSQKLDQWVRDSAVEIVNSLNEAPFLVHIYRNGNVNNRDGIKTVKEKAIADNWPKIEGRWRAGPGAPNGVIFVEQLQLETAKIGLGNNNKHQSTKLWGILIQGKGKRKCRTACYLLKTSEVECVAGICTHFCLLRVECFTQHADIQLTNLWLQVGGY